MTVIITKLLGWTLVAALIIGGMAAISGDLRNADDIGGAGGDVIGAGLFGGLFGDEGAIASAMKQREYFVDDPSSEKN